MPRWQVTNIHSTDSVFSPVEILNTVYSVVCGYSTYSKSEEGKAHGGHTGFRCRLQVHGPYFSDPLLCGMLMFLSREKLLFTDLVVCWILENETILKNVDICFCGLASFALAKLKR